MRASGSIAQWFGPIAMVCCIILCLNVFICDEALCGIQCVLIAIWEQ